MLIAINKTLIRHRAGEKPKRGFTLTEIAIVLGIVGLILGAIWVAAAAVYNNLRTSTATKQLLAISQGVRALYATSSNIGLAAGTDLTGTMCQAGVFPNDMGCTAAVAPNDPWNGPVYVTAQQVTLPGDSFSVAFNGVSQAGCIGMIVANSGQGRDPGLVNVTAANATIANTNTLTINTTFTSSGITAAQAATECAGTGTTNGVAFLFKLKS